MRKEKTQYLTEGSLSWRLRRAERIHNQATDCMILDEVTGGTDSEFNRCYRQANGISPDDPRASQEHLPLGRIATKLWSDNSKLIERLFLHERRIENSMYKTMHELEKLQKMQKAEQARAAEQQSTDESSPAKRHRSNLKNKANLPRRLWTQSLVQERIMMINHLPDSAKANPIRPALSPVERARLRGAPRARMPEKQAAKLSAGLGRPKSQTPASSDSAEATQFVGDGSAGN